MTQKERQERSKEEIFRAALEEFGTHGYEKVNMERICVNHGISKGMMYHYYSDKDELFLLCVEKVFAELKKYIEQEMERVSGGTALEAIKNFFMIREYYFQFHPREKMVFENAMVRPPRHLAERICSLRAPLRDMNHQFLMEQVGKMQLRPGLDQRKAARYLESVEYLFQDFTIYNVPEEEMSDLHTMLESGEELLEMVLFGVIRQDSVPAGDGQKDMDHSE